MRMRQAKGTQFGPWKSHFALSDKAIVTMTTRCYPQFFSGRKMLNAVPDNIFYVFFMICKTLNTLRYGTQLDSALSRTAHSPAPDGAQLCVSNIEKCKQFRLIFKNHDTMSVMTSCGNFPCWVLTWKSMVPEPLSILLIMSWTSMSVGFWPARRIAYCSSYTYTIHMLKAYEVHWYTILNIYITMQRASQ